MPSTGLDDDEARLVWLRRAYFGLDGRWYLKVRERYDADVAQEVDEDVCPVATCSGDIGSLT